MLQRINGLLHHKSTEGLNGEVGLPCQPAGATVLSLFLGGGNESREAADMVHPANSVHVVLIAVKQQVAEQHQVSRLGFHVDGTVQLWFQLLAHNLLENRVSRQRNACRAGKSARQTTLEM